MPKGGRGKRTIVDTGKPLADPEKEMAAMIAAKAMWASAGKPQGRLPAYQARAREAQLMGVHCHGKKR